MTTCLVVQPAGKWELSDCVVPALTCARVRAFARWMFPFQPASSRGGGGAPPHSGCRIAKSGSIPWLVILNQAMYPALQDQPCTTVSNVGRIGRFQLREKRARGRTTCNEGQLPCSSARSDSVFVPVIVAIISSSSASSTSAVQNAPKKVGMASSS